MIGENLKVIIPALKKNVAFQDDLIKKLSGVTLIQRAINKAYSLGIKSKEIFLLTDSEEIRVIADRNNINTFWNSKLTFEKKIHAEKIWAYLQHITKPSDYILFLSPYAPLLSVDSIELALNDLAKSDKTALRPIKEISRHLYDGSSQASFDALFGNKLEINKIESKSFFLMTGSFFENNFEDHVSVLEWPIENDVFEIESRQDWWVCEKLLNRRKIIFRVIGNKIVGTGHIYRALSIAHEITNDEVQFICDENSDIAVSVLRNFDYELEICNSKSIINHIITLKPDLVINDILSSNKGDVLPLIKNGIKVLNFEDLGEGAKFANLTINELYEKPLYDSKNTLWGHKYFFVRDEFNNAQPHSFEKNVKKILLSFGGTDQLNLTSRVYHLIKEICNAKNIYINIVSGYGYSNYDELKRETKNDPLVSITRATGIISTIMEDSQIAIVSNGRTVYELAHMNIPSIVISQHEREAKHGFAIEENGFINIGIPDEFFSKKLIEDSFLKLIDQQDFRYKLFIKTLKFSFNSNKQKILNKIDQLLKVNEEIS